MRNFLLIDNNEIYKTSINNLIVDIDENNVVFETTGLKNHAFDSIVKFYRDIDIVILNLAAVTITLEDAIEYLVKCMPSASLLVITDQYDRDHILKLIELGIVGIISVSSNQNDIRTAVRSVQNKQTYISSTILANVNLRDNTSCNGK